MRTVAVKPEWNYDQYAGAWLAFDDTHVYMSTYVHQYDPRVLRAPKAGGEAEVVGQYAESGGVTGVAVSRNSLYWGAMAWGGDVYRTDLQTGATETFHSARVTTLRVIGDSLWFTSVAENSWDQGPLGRVPLDGGPTTYSTRLTSEFFEGDDDHVYWIDSHPLEMKPRSSHDLLRINMATGAEELVANVPSLDGGGVAVTREWLFVNNRAQNEVGGIFRLKKPQP